MVKKMSKNIKEHEEGYWHIRKFNLRMPFFVIYLISTTASLVWIINVVDKNKTILVLPILTLIFGLTYGWIACVEKL